MSDNTFEALLLLTGPLVVFLLIVRVIVQAVV